MEGYGQDCCEVGNGCGEDACLSSIAANKLRGSGEVMESIHDAAKATNEAVNL